MVAKKRVRRVLKTRNSNKLPTVTAKRTVSAFIDSVSINDSEAGSYLGTKKQIKYGTKYQAACGIFSEYCDNTTIHGIKYLGEKKRPIAERIFWISVFVLSIYQCTSLTMNIWDKWNNNPVIVSFAEKITPVWQIPFPAVTICPETKTRPHVFNFTKILYKILEGHRSNLTEKENYYMEAISQVCIPHALIGKDYGLPFANASDLIDAMKETELIYNQTLLFCKWRYTLGFCEQFHRTITEEGLCYSFNDFDPRDVYRNEAFTDHISFEDRYNETVQWSLEYGYSMNSSPDSYPHRVLDAKPVEGLQVMLAGNDQDNDLLCRGITKGFKMLLRTPGDIPLVSHNVFNIQLGQDVTISMKPKIMTASEGIKHYDPMRRQCYFQKDRYLRYFKVYSQSNCELECLSNFTLKECGCVKFSMPRSVDTPVCGAAKIECIFNAERALLVKKFEQDLKTSAKNLSGKTDCNCLQACTSITYEADITQVDLNIPTMLKSKWEESYLEENPSVRLSRLSIFFNDAEYQTSKRSELYGTTDFLANCGGLLGLFMGVSTLSIAELVYFCSVRLLTNLRMRRRKRLELERLKNPNEDVIEAGMELAEKEE